MICFFTRISNYHLLNVVYFVMENNIYFAVRTMERGRESGILVLGSTLFLEDI